jgi:type I restriction enzyme S subunit
VRKDLDTVQTINEKELPYDWKLATISELISSDGIFVDGDWFESKDQDPNGDVRLIQLADIGDGEYKDRSFRFLTYKKAIELGCTFLKKGDVLVARMPDPLGRACIFPGDQKKAVTAVDIAIIRPDNSKFDSHCLMYFINAPAFRSAVASMQSGSTRKRISRSSLSRILLPVPPRPQQDSIVDEIEKQFSRLDESVASLKRVKANLKRYKATVLKAAVEGKLTEGWRREHPNVEPATELLKRIVVERKKKWEADHPGKKYKEPALPDTSNLYELPKGWVWTTVGQLCKCVVPNRDKPKSFSGNIPWITMPDFADFSIDIYKAKSGMGLTEDEVRVYRARLIPKGSVVMSCVGRFGIVGVLQNRAVINQQLHAFMIPTGLNNRYIAYAIKTQVPYMESIATATTIHYLNKDNCNSVPIAVPTAEEQNAIVDEIERAFSVAHNIEVAVETNLKRADRLRQSILKEAFSGRLSSIEPI